MAYNPYEQEMMRRRLQQPQMEQPMMPQQPSPVIGGALYAGPEQEQWIPMGDSGGQQQDMQNAGAGMASLIQRFKRPKGASPADAKSAWEKGGSL